MKSRSMFAVILISGFGCAEDDRRAGDDDDGTAVSLDGTATTTMTTASEDATSSPQDTTDEPGTEGDSSGTAETAESGPGTTSTDSADDGSSTSGEPVDPCVPLGPAVDACMQVVTDETNACIADCSDLVFPVQCQELVCGANCCTTECLIAQIVGYNACFAAAPGCYEEFWPCQHACMDTALSCYQQCAAPVDANACGETDAACRLACR